VTIKAKYAGTCKACNRKISVGDEIEWTKGNGARHLNCETPRKSIPESNGHKTITVQDFDYAAEAGHVFKEGNKWLTVISSRGWWCDEPLSFGKLDGEDGYIYDWTCREATPAEIASADTKQKAAKAKEDAERATRIAKNQAEKAEYEARAQAFFAKRDSLIETHGLIETKSVPTLDGTVEESAITPPGKGFSWTVFLRVTRDTDGNVLCVSQSNEETGTSYWATPEIAEKGNSVKRISQWWREKGYGVDSYPGPGIPREELTAPELSEVERLETLKFEACVKSQLRTAPYNKSKGELLKPLSACVENNKAVFTVVRKDLEAWEAEVSKIQSLLADRFAASWAETYDDPKRGTYKTHAPLAFEIRVAK
jgi:hypothetical protein